MASHLPATRDGAVSHPVLSGSPRVDGDQAFASGTVVIVGLVQLALSLGTSSSMLLSSPRPVAVFLRLSLQHRSRRAMSAKQTRLAQLVQLSWSVITTTVSDV